MHDLYIKILLSLKINRLAYKTLILITTVSIQFYFQLITYNKTATILSYHSTARSATCFVILSHLQEEVTTQRRWQENFVL